MKVALVWWWMLTCVAWAQVDDTTHVVESPTSSVEVSTPYRPGDHELFFMPTATTMPSGSAYFSVYELFFVNVTMAVSSSTHIGVFTLFPMSVTFLETATFGIKQQVVSGSSGAVALWGTLTPRANFFSYGAVASVGTASLSFHGSVGQARPFDDGEAATLVLFGVKGRLSPTVTAIAEYTNLAEFMKWENRFYGLLTIGVRSVGPEVSWEIAGLRPLVDTDGGWYLLPFLKATVRL